MSKIERIKKLLASFNGAYADEVAFMERLEEPSEAMWNGLARDIVMWERMYASRPTGELLHEHLRNCGTPMPDWLKEEIADHDSVPPKGTVAVVIFKAMIEEAQK